jgi:17beta-estradiol 17-dehydrogenase / very-long-chain 3-oxoacyl-CoA reductase
MFSMIDWPLFILGTCFIGKYLLELICFGLAISHKSQLRPVRDSWALITASTDGIGLGFAEELARKGFNIVQLSRNSSKMSQVSTDLEKKYGISCKNIEFTFDKWQKDPSSHYHQLLSSLDGLKIELVVNNVGVAVFGFESNIEKILEMLSINIWTVVFISKLLIQNNNIGKKTQFINLSSIGAVPGLGLPSLSAYAASKSFTVVFTDVLNSEGVIGLALAPGWVDTPQTKPCGDIRSWLITKNDCAISAIEQLGSVSCSYGHLKHWIAAWEYRIFNPRIAWLRLV